MATGLWAAIKLSRKTCLVRVCICVYAWCVPYIHAVLSTKPFLNLLPTSWNLLQPNFNGCTHAHMRTCIHAHFNVMHTHYTTLHNTTYCHLVNHPQYKSAIMKGKATTMLRRVCIPYTHCHNTYIHRHTLQYPLQSTHSIYIHSTNNTDEDTHI